MNLRRTEECPHLLSNEPVAVLDFHLARVQHDVPRFILRHLPDRRVPQELWTCALSLFRNESRDKKEKKYIGTLLLPLSSGHGT